MFMKGGGGKHRIPSEDPRTPNFTMCKGMFRARFIHIGFCLDHGEHTKGALLSERSGILAAHKHILSTPFQTLLRNLHDPLCVRNTWIQTKHSCSQRRMSAELSREHVMKVFFNLAKFLLENPSKVPFNKQVYDRHFYAWLCRARLLCFFSSAKDKQEPGKTLRVAAFTSSASVPETKLWAWSQI